MCQAEVTPQAPGSELATRNHSNAPRCTGYAQRSIRQHSRPIRLVRLVVVRILIAENVEGST